MQGGEKMRKASNEPKKIYKTEKEAINDLNRVIKGAFTLLKPPEKLHVDEWADKYRWISSESASEAGPWRTSRTPYSKEIMRAFTDPRVRIITVVAPSQVGKSEIELNCLGYIIDNAPGSTMYVHPDLSVAREFSRHRIEPMLNDCKRLREKMQTKKKSSSSNTILQKSFPGGMLKIIGTESAKALASTPVRYLIGDERDRWAFDAAGEGDSWELAEARQTTFYNSKALEVSSPTVKGKSPIVKSFMQGTQAYWCHKCPECGEYHFILFEHIRYETEVKEIGGEKIYKAKVLGFACPNCGVITPEKIMKRQPQKWIMNNAEAYESGHVSFWISPFAHPWRQWRTITDKFLKVKDDPLKLRTFVNTVLGQPFEDRGEIADEDTLLARREDYGAELPEGVLALTCGVDTQDNRLEYEVIGHGYFGETWGIEKGYIMGVPDTPEVWARLDDVIEHVYKFKDGKGLKILMTCVDSGGHYTQEVYEYCRTRFEKHVVAIKGKGGDIQYINLPRKAIIRGNKKKWTWLYTLGVDAGKSTIMGNLKVQTAGPKFCHFPLRDNYNMAYFNGLLSEKLVCKKTTSGFKWYWERIPGHAHNEALDCRNYAMAAFKIINPDLSAIERRLKNIKPKREAITARKPRKRAVSNPYLEGGDDW